MAGWTSLLNGLNTAALAAFGREVIWKPQAGAQATIRGVLETAHEADENAPGVCAALFVRVADLERRPERGDQVTVDGLTYTVFDIEADVSGGAVLRLRQA